MASPHQATYNGRFHYIPPGLVAFEPSRNTASSESQNTLIWIGGLFDTLGSVSYPFSIASALPSTWSLATVSLSSAGKSWGVSSIFQDANEIAKIVAHFEQLRPSGKIVIMGHSTGCQDCIEYLTGSGSDSRPKVDGVILQAPVSDREAIAHELPEAMLHEANQMALKMCREGKDKDAMPYRITKNVFGRAAITARRWVDIASPGPDHTGADDFFSSDLSDDRLRRTFGKLPPATALLILYSGNDESVPPSVDKQKLVSRWINAAKQAGGQVDEKNGSIVPGATHNYGGCPDAVVQDLVRRVVGFVTRLDNGDFRANESRM